MQITRILSAVFLLSFSISLTAQNDNNFSLKLAYGMVNSQQPDPSLTGTGTQMFPNYKQPMKSNLGLEVNLSLDKSSDVGLYFSSSELNRLSVLQLEGDDPKWTYVLHPTTTLYYGLNYLYHIPFLKQFGKSRFDPYGIFRMGLVSEKYSTGAGTISDGGFSYEYTHEVWDKPKFETGLGIGVNYYLTKYLGVYAEVMGGSFYNNQYFKWKTGIVFKF